MIPGPAEDDFPDPLCRHLIFITVWWVQVYRLGNGRSVYVVVGNNVRRGSYEPASISGVVGPSKLWK